MQPFRDPLIITNDLVRGVSRGLYAIQSQLRKDAKPNPHHAWRSVVFEDTQKRAAVADVVAEWQFRAFLTTEFARFGFRLRVVGEESLTVADDADDGVVECLLDPIDGTDLAQRAVAEWCSAAVVYTRDPAEILAGFLVIPDRGVIFSLNHADGAYVFPESDGVLDTNYRKVSGPVESMLCLDQSPYIAGYTQKLRNFRKVARTFNPSLEADDLRLWGLSGPPMFARLIHGHSSEQIHAVMELQGQQLHDAIPGLYVALKAGASVIDLDRNSQISERQLAMHLSKGPLTRMRYVAACTESLARDIRDNITDDDPREIRLQVSMPG